MRLNDCPKTDIRHVDRSVSPTQVRRCNLNDGKISVFGLASDQSEESVARKGSLYFLHPKGEKGPFKQNLSVEGESPSVLSTFSGTTFFQLLTRFTEKERQSKCSW